MVSARVRFNFGEKKPVYIDVDAGRGNTLQVLSLSTDPAGAIDPYVRMITPTGEEVDVLREVGFTDGAARKVSVWGVLDLAGRDGEQWDLEFHFEAQGTGETFTRRYVERVTVIQGKEWLGA